MKKIVVPAFIYSMQSKKHFKQLVILAAILLLAVAGVSVYRYYVTSRSADAHHAFIESLEAYETTLNAPVENQRWDDVIRSFSTGFERFAKTSYGPFFLTYKAQALQFSGDHAQAVHVMNDAVTRMSSSSPLYYLYSTKSALMKIDSTDASVAQTGHQELQALAGDAKNPNRDMAQYYIGLYALDAQDFNRARTVLTDLVTQGSKDSPWVSLAQEKVNELLKK